MITIHNFIIKFRFNLVLNCNMRLDKFLMYYLVGIEFENMVEDRTGEREYTYM